MGFFQKTKIFGRPIRKVRAGLTTAVIVTAVKWASDHFGMDLDDGAVKEIVSAIRQTIDFGADVWAPVIAAYFVRSDVRDVENIPVS